MKLSDLLLEDDNSEKGPYGFEFGDTEVDPETGGITSKVTYTPLRNLKVGIAKNDQDFKAVVRKYPDDERLLKLYEEYVSFKRRFNRYTNLKFGKL